MKSRKNSSIKVNGKDAGVTSSLGIASVVALTGVSLMASQAEAQTAAGIAGVQSATVGADGVLTLLLENGQQLLIQAAEFTVAANGSIVLSEVALAQVAQAVAAAGGVVAGAGLAAAGVVVGVASEGTDPAPEEGPNNPAVIGGAVTGAVTEDVAVAEGNMTTSGTLTVTDADAGQAVFVAQTSAASTYGSFTLATNGAWTYTATNGQTAIQSLRAGQSLTDSFTAITADGTAQAVTVTINGTNDAAVIGGAVTGAVTEDVAVAEGNLATSGTLTVTDSDAGQAVFVAQTSAAGTYGSFTLAINGAWTYTATNGQTAIQSLGAGQTLTDSFTAVTADGTSQVVTVTITGTAEPIAAVQLSAVETGLGGFVINGISANDQSGFSVSNAGDVNGDGLDDLIVGAPLVDTSGDFAGASYVVFGKTSGTAVELSAIAAGNGGFVINGVTAYDQAGFSVSTAGDVNGDGLADLIVGAYSRDAAGLDFGASYVVFGKADGAAVSLQDIEGGAAGGFVIKGAAEYDKSGESISTAGDVNGDGFDDLIVGAIGVGNYIGASYVVFGKSTPTAVDLSALSNGGFVINGVTSYGVSGSSVSGAGDVNGDGLDDLIVGAYGEDPNGENSGASYVVFGKTSATAVQLSNFEGGEGNGFVIKGVSEQDNAGFSVSTAGDVNGDGLDDLIIGARQASPNGFASGASYVVFGKETATAVDLSALGDGGFVINGVTSGERSGFSVSSAGDVNGDGLDDLIIGAPYSSPTGSSYVVFGKSSSTTVELSTIAAGDGGFVIRGAVAASFNGSSGNDFSGRSVSAAGDVNGDGFDDLIIGAPYDDPNLPIGGDPNNQGAAGASFVVFGGDFSQLATQIGTVGDDSLTGTAGTDNFIGGTGNDSLRGSGGADVLHGGAGNDRLEISDLSFARIDGGNGFDTLALTRPGLTLDLTALDNTSLKGIEQIDLNSANNALVLNKLEVLRLSDTTNTLRVLGNGDRVTVTDSGWVKGDSIFDNSVGRTFDVYTNGNATLEVGLGVQVFGLPIPAVQLSAVEQGFGGFVMNGTTSQGRAGTSVSNAGDLNGDGLDDVIVGAPGANIGGGASYVVFGKSLGDAVQLSNLGAGGFVINGVSNDRSGVFVSNAGDVNGDGIDDLIIGAPEADPNNMYNAGTAYVVFGKSNNTTVQLSDIEAGNGGFVINGVTDGEEIGRVVSGAGDVNGDGFDDLIVGTTGSYSIDEYAGKAYVVFGESAPTAVNLSSLGTKGFVINGGSAYDYAGKSVSNAGDVNGDGLDDLIVSAPTSNSLGKAYVVFGKNDSSAVELSNLGTGGFVINSATSVSGRLGDNATSVSNAGDVNGDGFDDLIVASPGAIPEVGRSAAGVSYVVFGKANNTAVDLETLGTGGFVINGFSAGDQSGYSVSTAGDVNGDGLDDLIIGAPFADPNGPESGASYVVFGKADNGLVELSAVRDGIGGFAINGVTGIQPPNSWVLGDWSGFSVSTAGDVNGDGFDDLIVGAREDDPRGESSGASFVVFGGNLTGAVTVLGTANAEGLDGTSGADVIFGAQGNDLINGRGGDDRLSGGSGADTFVVGNLAGTTTIIDFTAAIGSSQDDQLDVRAFGFANFGAFAATLEEYGQGGHDVRAQLDSDTSIIFQGIALGDLTENNVILFTRNDV